MKKPEVRERLFQDIRKELDQQPPEGILMVGFNKASSAKVSWKNSCRSC